MSTHLQKQASFKMEKTYKNKRSMSLINLSPEYKKYVSHEKI